MQLQHKKYPLPKFAEEERESGLKPAGSNVDHPELLGDECEVDRLDGKTFTLLALNNAISQSTNLNISQEGRVQFWTRCQSNDPHTWFSLLSFLLK